MIGRFNGRRKNGVQQTLPGIEEVMPRLTHEMNRARRYRRPLTFAHFRARHGETISVRAIDVAARVHADGIVVALPETSRDGAEGFLSRVEPQLAYEGSCRIVTFPEDTVTLAGVLERLLEGELDRMPNAPAISRNGMPDEDRRAGSAVSHATSNGGRH